MAPRKKKSSTAAEKSKDSEAPPASSRSYTRMAIIVALLLLFGVALQRGWIVAAMVNNRPIFRWELTGVLTARFGQQALEGMISERLIADAAREAGVEISDEDVAAEQAIIVGNLGAGVDIEELLAFQGMTKEEFDTQIRLQLAVRELLGRDIEITQEDIDNVIATGSGLLVSTDEAALREEARQLILDQKISERLQPWFLELRQSSSITTFLP